MSFLSFQPIFFFTMCPHVDVCMLVLYIKYIYIHTSVVPLRNVAKHVFSSQILSVTVSDDKC